ncbi:MAG: hypothetical protein GWN58_17605 [Anaerolineae bacterium]|nr:hypothetical protein [Anaerolineae bacterium]
MSRMKRHLEASDDYEACGITGDCETCHARELVERVADLECDTDGWRAKIEAMHRRAQHLVEAAEEWEERCMVAEKQVDRLRAWQATVVRWIRHHLAEPGVREHLAELQRELETGHHEA